MKIGYARVSTQEQCLDRQLDALEKAGTEKVFMEKMTGTKSNRPELDRVREMLRAGDTLVVESLSRLGRSTKDLLNLMDEFKARGVTVESLKESIDTSTASGTLLISVLSAISQFERDLIVQRTTEGLTAARERGRKGGRPPVDSRALAKAIKLYQGKSHSVKEIVDLTGISAPTLYRGLKRHQEAKT